MDVHINMSVHAHTHQCIHTDTQIFLDMCDQKDQAFFVNDYKTGGLQN